MTAPVSRKYACRKDPAPLSGAPLHVIEWPVRQGLLANPRAEQKLTSRLSNLFDLFDVVNPPSWTSFTVCQLPNLAAGCSRHVRWCHGRIRGCDVALQGPGSWQCPGRRDLASCQTPVRLQGTELQSPYPVPLGQPSTGASVNRGAHAGLGRRCPTLARDGRESRDRQQLRKASACSP